MRTKKTTLLLLKIIEKILSHKSLHARWLNSLSYFEYIGTRKMLKSLPAHMLNKYFLEHIQEESRHSLFFKTLAQKTANKELGFKEHEMLVPKQVANYFQQVDHYSLKFSFDSVQMYYLYTTYAVEQRAMVVYSFYNEILRKRNWSFSLQSVLNDERAHLDFVLNKIQKMDPLWESHIEEISLFEHQKYFAFLIALEEELFEKPLLEECLDHPTKYPAQKLQYQKF